MRKEGGNIVKLGTVEVQLRGFKGNQGPKGGVFVRIKNDADKGGEAVKLFQEVYEIHC